MKNKKILACMLAGVMAVSLCSCGNKTKDVSIDPSYEGYINADIQYLSYEDAEGKAKAEISDYQAILDAIKDENNKVCTLDGSETDKEKVESEEDGCLRIDSLTYDVELVSEMVCSGDEICNGGDTSDCAYDPRTASNYYKVYDVAVYAGGGENRTESQFYKNKIIAVNMYDGVVSVRDMASVDTSTMDRNGIYIDNESDASLEITSVKEGFRFVYSGLNDDIDSGMSGIAEPGETDDIYYFRLGESSAKFTFGNGKITVSSNSTNSSVIQLIGTYVYSGKVSDTVPVEDHVDNVDNTNVDNIELEESSGNFEVIEEIANSNTE